MPIRTKDGPRFEEVPICVDVPEITAVIDVDKRQASAILA